MNLREKILRRIASFSFKNYKAVLLVSGISLLVSLLVTLSLEFESDVSKLLPRDAEITNTYFRFLKDFGGIDRLLIVFETDKGDILDEVPFIEDFALNLRNSALVEDVEYKIGGETRRYFEEVFSKKALLFLSKEDLDALKKRLHPEDIKKEIARSRERLLSPFGNATKDMILLDPLNLSSIFRKYLIPQSGMNIDLSSGYYASGDRKMLLMIVRPKGSAQDIAFDRKLMEEIKGIEDSLRQSYKNASLHIGYTGGYIIALRDASIIKLDIIKNTLTSLFSVILFIFFFRGIEKIIYPAVPFVLSLLWTLSFSSPVLGHLSDVTGAFSAMLIGLGIDLIIIIYNRYLFERAEGIAPSQAIEIAAGRTGMGVVTGVMTTVVSFYSLLVSRFSGIKELGFLTGTGMLFFLIAVFFTLPALISWRSSSEKRPRKMGSTGIEKIALHSYRHPYMTIIIVLLITILLLLNIAKLKINNDPKTLRPSGNPAVMLQEKVGRKIGGTDSIIITAESSSLKDLLSLNEKLEEKVLLLKKEEVPVKAIDSISRLLPSQERQEMNLKTTFNAEEIDRAVKESLSASDFQTNSFNEYRNRLKTMLTNKEKITIDEIKKYGMGKALERYLREDKGTYKSAAYCYPDSTKWNKEDGEKIFKLLTSISPSIKVSGSELIREELTGILKKDIILITLLSFVLITVLVYMDFRSIRITIFCQLPLILGIIWMLGTMVFFGMELNFMNCIAAALILGIGIDYAIHLMTRYREGGGIGLAVYQAGRGVVVAALATMVGFGSIIFSDFPGLSSMGAVTLLGVGYCLLLTLTLLPATLRIYEKMMKKG